MLSYKKILKDKEAMNITGMEDLHNEFYKSYLSEYISKDDISDDDWDLITHHIETHKYLLSQDRKVYITLSRAYDSWVEYVVDPFFQSIEKRNVLKYTDINVVKLFKDVMQRWHYMKQRIPKDVKNIDVSHAVDDYCYHLKTYPFFKKFFLKTF